MADLGALTTTYQPTGTGCQSIHIGSSTGLTWIQQGTISNCLPSNFCAQDGYYYSPGVCPQGYTYACNVGVGIGSSTITAATCCPRSFACRSGRTSDDPNACISTMISDTSYIVDILTYETGSPTSISTTSRFYGAGNSVYAKGLIVWRAATDAEWSGSSTLRESISSTMISRTTMISITPTSTATSIESILGTTTVVPDGYNTDANNDKAQSSHPGLSSGAKIGVGLGVPLGVLFFMSAIVATYIFGRSRGRQLAQSSVLDCCHGNSADSQGQVYHELAEERKVSEMSARREPAELMELRQ
ncbi:hypothetical protein GGR54DRAFT_599881 [Hypoxylon sp. NC1633]|nr:hypothetical protein GGR54DRAFT_599881 [Hypoxylon sp. NC1633]